MDDVLLPTHEAARRLGLAPATLAKWRCLRSDGPPFRRLGARVLYSSADLNAWVQLHAKQASTRDTAAEAAR